jgi:D-amino-acid dehydrogenase
MRRAIVLGAGMVGVSTALQLQRRGWSVSLVDRREPGRETSYGNAGIIQSEALNPHPMPRGMMDLARIAMGLTNTVRYRKLTLPLNATSLVKYWWHSAPDRHARISAAYGRLIALSASEHEGFITASHSDELIVRKGYRVLHREQAGFDADIAKATRLANEYGITFKVLSAQELMAAEGGLLDGGLGGLHWLDSWNVRDPGALVQAYADLFVQLGGTIHRGDASTLRERSSGWSIETDDGELFGDSVVVALGPWSPELVKRFGYRARMVRKRGYHRHFKGGSELELPLGIPANGCFLSPTDQGIRITTGAELTGPNSKATPVQLAVAERAARELIDLGDPVEAEPWFGTRPCMPDMLPVIGRAPRHESLWFNFGHGHQGFTLGPIAGRLVAEMMGGESTVVESEPYRFERL